MQEKDRIDRIGISDREPVIRRRIGGTTYLVGIHFNEQSRETMQDKILRMIKNDIRGEA